MSLLDICQLVRKFFIFGNKFIYYFLIIKRKTFVSIWVGSELSDFFLKTFLEKAFEICTKL